ncbi:hypothetical protein ILYODFUR_033069 [Ilyodon furcidens]|uniref:Metabotropic glutamate receptor Homer-binding domain-containing protein n=1 Tax=Ilyodon furcidens TaxID=33524 RepID=A0ABV0TNU7_9TELE
MSFHVKKKDPVEVNQTAIIKPFSKERDSNGDNSVTEQYEGPQLSQSFTCSPSQSPLPTISPLAVKARGCHSEESGEEVQVLPTYAPELSCGVRRRGGDNGQIAAIVDGGAISIISVGEIGQTQGTTIMDQISCVVNRFTANISELNTMMLPGGSILGPPSTTPLPVASENSPCPSQYLNRQTPSTVTTYAEVTAVSSCCDNRAKIYEQLAGTCTGGKRAKNPEELMALTPPSPFRDFSLSSNESSPPSLSPASEAECDHLLLRHYQSSSSL